MTRHTHRLAPGHGMLRRTWRRLLLSTMIASVLLLPADAKALALKFDKIISLDAEHARLQDGVQLRGVRLDPSGARDVAKQTHLAVAKDLERLIHEYEVARGHGKTDWRIGLLLSDYGDVLLRLSEVARAEAAFRQSEQILTPFVGQNPQLDLVYAQMMARAGSLYHHDGKDKSLIAATTVRAVRLLEERGSLRAKNEAVRHYAGYLRGLARYPGSDPLVREAIALMRSEGPCGDWFGLSEELTIGLETIDPAQARSIAQHAYNMIQQSRKAGCPGKVTGLSIPQAKLLKDGTAKPSLADAAELGLMQAKRETPGEWSRAAYVSAATQIAVIAQHGTEAQLLRVLRAVASHVPYVRPNMTPAEAAHAMAGVMEVGARDFAAAEVFHEHALKFARPASGQTRAAEWSRIAAAAAAYHARFGRRNRAVELASEVLARQPATLTEKAAYTRALVVLSQQALDTGDTAEATSKLVNGLRIASDPPNVRAFQEAAQALIASGIALEGQDIASVIDASRAVHRFVEAGRAANEGKKYNERVQDYDSFDRSLYPFFLMRYGRGTEVTPPAKPTDRHPLERAASRLIQDPRAPPVASHHARTILGESADDHIVLKKFVSALEVLRRQQAPGTPENNCDYGGYHVRRLYLEAKVARKDPNYPAIAQAIPSNLCAGNSLESMHDAAESRAHEGVFWLSAGEPKIALTYLRYAVNDLVEKDDQEAASDPASLRWLSLYSRALAESGGADAVAAAERAARLLQIRLGKEGAAGSGSVLRETARNRKIFDNYISLLWAGPAGQGNEAAIGKAFAASQIGRTASAGAALSRFAARIATSSPELAALVRRRQDALDGVSTAFKTIGQAEDDRIKSAALERSKQLQAEIGTIEAELKAKFPRFAEYETVSAAPLKDITAQLHPEEALFVTHSTETEVLLWLITRDGIRMRRADAARPELEGLINDLRFGLDIRGDRPPRFRTSAAVSLHRLLLGPFASELSSIKHLLIAADGAIETIPFAVLMEREATSGAAPAWLVDRMALSSLPNVKSLLFLRAESSSGSAPELFLGVGDPVLGPPGNVRALTIADAIAINGKVVRESLVKMASLPDTKDELVAMSLALGRGQGTLLLGSEATEARVKAAPLDRYRVISFSTHALVAGDLEGLREPALVLTPPAQSSSEEDGVLTASEIALMRMNADLIILSACNTAAADGRPNAEGLSGLARAFFNAGARALIVSHWRVDSKSTADLMTLLARGLASGLDPAEALRRAMVRMMRNANSVEELSPSFWGGFFVVGAPIPSLRRESFRGRWEALPTR